MMIGLIMRRVVVAAMLAASFAAPAFAQKSKDTLRFGFSLSMSTIDPYYPRGREIVMVVGELMFDTLVYRDEKTFENKPLLAKSWTWVDNRTLDLDLRDDVKWHDGQPFTAEDVKYTFDYITDPKNKVYRPDQSEWIKSTEILGPHKVRLRMDAPFGPAVEYLSQVLPIVPKNFYGPGGVAGANGRMVGTGPYKLLSFAPEKEAKFEINDLYFAGSAKGKPSIRHMVFRNFADQATEVAELLSGGVDWIWRVSPDHVAQLGRVPNVKVQSGGTMRTYWMSYDVTGTAGKAFTDLRVRRAAAHAIDRATLTRELVSADAPVLNVPCYPAQFGCPPESSVTHYDYDMEKAKKLMAEAGYANGFDTTLYYYHQGNNRTLCEAIQGYLRKIGIRASLQEMTVKTFFEAVDQGKVPLNLQSFGQWNINDVEILMPVYFGGGNRDVVKDPTLLAWFKESKGDIDAKQREALFHKAGKRIIEEAYMTPLFLQTVHYAHAADFDFTPWPDENPRFYKTRWK